MQTANTYTVTAINIHDSLYCYKFTKLLRYLITVIADKCTEINWPCCCLFIVTNLSAVCWKLWHHFPLTDMCFSEEHHCIYKRKSAWYVIMDTGYQYHIKLYITAMQVHPIVYLSIVLFICWQEVLTPMICWSIYKVQVHEKIWNFQLE